MKKVVLFAVFAAVMLAAAGATNQAQSLEARVACCNPPPTCPDWCPPVK